MKGIVLAGGSGSRLFPLTKVTNKHLLPVYNAPMIFYPIITLKDSGINEILVVIGGESVGDMVRLLKDGSDLGVSLSYTYQKGSGGIAEALSLAEKFASGESVAVILGDNIFEDTFGAEVQSFSEGCILHLKEVDVPNRFGVAELEDDMSRIKQIVEKPEVPMSHYAVTGFYIYDNTVFDKIRHVRETKGYSERGELEITDVNNLYIKEGKTAGVIISGFWSDAGTFESLLKAQNYAAAMGGLKWQQ